MLLRCYVLPRSRCTLPTFVETSIPLRFTLLLSAVRRKAYGRTAPPALPICLDAQHSRPLLNNGRILPNLATTNLDQIPGKPLCPSPRCPYLPYQVRKDRCNRFVITRRVARSSFPTSSPCSLSVLTRITRTRWRYRLVLYIPLLFNMLSK